MVCIATIFAVFIVVATATDPCSLNAHLIQYGDEKTLPFDEITSIQVNTHRDCLRVFFADITTITNTRVNDDWER
jgi:hypothetical protein